LILVCQSEATQRHHTSGRGRHIKISKVRRILGKDIVRHKSSYWQQVRSAER
jgi:hypothetical protein